MHGWADTKITSVKLPDILGPWKGMCKWETLVMSIRRLGNGQDAIYVCVVSSSENYICYAIYKASLNK
jgi:hypothetical protein